MTAVEIAVAVLCAVASVQALLVFAHLAELRDLVRLTPPDPPVWPSVSVITAARDEAVDIEGSIASRLAEGYPDLEIVVVDDRSSDATPEILAAFARRDPRVRPIRVDELPNGWLGKVHALAVGAEAAVGDWLLFSDADVFVKPGTLRTAVAHCEAEGFDLLALIPEFRSRSGIVDVLWAIFVRVMALAASPAAVRDPRRKPAVGSGSFTLVRRSAYDATPGFEHLRLETADDMALGAMVKRAGARSDFVNGRHAVSVSIYDTFGAFFRGIEKNGSSLGTAPFWLLSAAFVLLGFVEYSPLVAIALGAVTGTGWLLWFGVGAGVLATAGTVAPLHRNTGMVWPALLWPVGWVLMAGGVLRSVWLFHRRGGVVWRGTFYPAAELLEAQRFTF